VLKPKQSAFEEGSGYV